MLEMGRRYFIDPNGAIDIQYYKLMFKTLYQQQIDLFLSADFYNGDDVSPSRVNYDSPAFALKDPTKYTTLKYYGKDCF